MAETGARLAIHLLQEAALAGEIDPWDVDVIAVIDGFLDQLRQRIEVPRMAAVLGGSYEQDLAETSEAFLAASVLVGLKAEMLESAIFPPDPANLEEYELEEGCDWGGEVPVLPRRPERRLLRRLVAPPPLQRPVTLGELIQQLEQIAERLEQEEANPRRRHRTPRFSERAAIAEVTALAHREKLPETTAALSRFLQRWDAGPDAAWVSFEQLVDEWAAAAADDPQEDLDRDRVGVFWALLFLCSQGRVDLEQAGGLYGPLRLRSHRETGESVVVQAGTARWSGAGSAEGPARDLLAA